jgi:hypothetical protein
LTQQICFPGRRVSSSADGIALIIIFVTDPADMLSRKEGKFKCRWDSLNYYFFD